MKRIVLCADDYGQAPHISQAICRLVQNGRISATSCMVNGVDWPQQAAQLKPFWHHVDVGMHLNFTHGNPLSTLFIKTYGKQFSSLRALMVRAFCRQLDVEALQAEIEAQLDAFTAAFGFGPRFIDGHQHVHQFPMIRDALLCVYKKRLRVDRAYIRLLDAEIKPFQMMREMKKGIIYLTGTRAFKNILHKESIPHNRSFGGAYHFSQRRLSYRELFLSFLEKIKDRGLIMCHPGLATITPGHDPIAEQRVAEYQYLSGNQFLIDCHDYQVRLWRLGANSHSIGDEVLS